MDVHAVPIETIDVNNGRWSGMNTTGIEVSGGTIIRVQSTGELVAMHNTCLGVMSDELRAQGHNPMSLFAVMGPTFGNTWTCGWHACGEGE